MYDLARIDLGKDEAEQDRSLREYFLKTTNYKNSLAGTKTIVIGRKGSGKSAIFTLMRDELEKSGAVVIPVTPDQYSWSALKDYQEKGILSGFGDVVDKLK
jgi:ABC-type multidrug transport system fused ATPase/permease subunit